MERENAYTIACGLQKMDSVQHFEKKYEYPSNKKFEKKQHKRLVSTTKKDINRSTATPFGFYNK